MRKHLVCLGFAACTSAAPVVTNNPMPDAPSAPQPDGPSASTAQALTGKVMDYFGGVPVANAAIATEGLAPPISATSGSDGSYTMQIADGSKLFVVTTLANYRPTRSAAISVGDTPVMQDVYVMSEQDVKNQYTGVGIATPIAGTAFVAAEMEMNNGMPVVGIPLTNVQLLDGANQPVPNVTIYFFNAQGAVDAAQTTSVVSTATPPRARVALLDVPPGNYTLAVTYAGGMGNVQTNTPIATTADGATLAVTGGLDAGGGGGGGGAAMPNPNPTFATDIYPRLQRAAQGGLGCANCHTANGPAAILPYDAPAATVLANISTLQAINLTTPATSLILVRPLYEAPPAVPDHPNATFIDVNDLDYKQFLLWITQGAKP